MENNTGEGGRTDLQTNIFSHAALCVFICQTHDLTQTHADQTDLSDALAQNTLIKRLAQKNVVLQATEILHADIKSIGGWTRCLSSQSGPLHAFCRCRPALLRFQNTQHQPVSAHTL